MPRTVALESSKKLCGNVPTTCCPFVYQSASALMTVAVPSVAINASIRANSTSTALKTPTSAPPIRTIGITTGHGIPKRTCNEIAMISQSMIPKPIERSILPAAIGIITASAISALID